MPPTLTRRSDAATATAAVRVLKAGGAVVTDPERRAALCRHVAEAVAAGQRLLLVHGGGDLITALHRRMGVTATRHEGLRATSDEGMELTTMALRGAVNAQLVAGLVARGVDALGVSGVDLSLLRSDFLNRQLLGRVGGPPRVAAPRLRAWLAEGLTPVLAPVCLGPDGGLLNVNADTVAHAVAVALEADSLDFLSDVPGIYRADGAAHPDGPVVSRLTPAEAKAMLASEQIHGGMIPKLQAALAAVGAGVRRVRIGDLNSLGAARATEVTR